MAIKIGPQGLTQTLSSGYGDGLTAKQKKPVNVPMDPLVLGGNDSTGDENQVETSIITVNNEPKALSLNHTVTKLAGSICKLELLPIYILNQLILLMELQ